MHKRKKLFLVIVATLALVATACSSNSSSSTTTTSGGSSSSGGSGKTVTIGVLTDATGEASSTNKTSVQGVQAGVYYAKDRGYTIKYVVADTQTSESGVLSAAQDLVEQDHVLAVVAVSSLTFLAAKFLTQQNVPVIGAAEDASEWVAAPNMFPVTGRLDAGIVSTTQGDFFKMMGVTNLGSLGYSISPQSADAAEAAASSAKHAGIKVGYLNASFEFGSTNVQPIALAMKQAGVDGMTASVDSNTGLLLVEALRQEGANIKVPLLPTGYGGDLQQAGPNAEQLAQGVYFLSEFQPVEMRTPATLQFQHYLTQAGVTTDPTFAEYNGYASIVLLVQALQAAGANPSQAKLMTALSGIHDFNAAGLFGAQSINFSDHTAESNGPGNCEYIVKLSGSTFHLVSGADPICGTNIPNDTVSPPSS
jgi:ABC-type branched-subunit amino acid transport system substrate-binding protein